MESVGTTATVTAVTVTVTTVTAVTAVTAVATVATVTPYVHRIKSLKPPIAPSLLHERQYLSMIAQQRQRRCCSAKNISTTKAIELI